MKGRCIPWRLLGLCALGLSLAAPPAAAVTREDGAPAYALGLGDAVRASGVGTSALFFNPAGMSRAAQYAVEAGYAFTNDLSGHTFVISAIDSATNDAFALGLSYSYVSSMLSGRDRDGHNFRGGASTGYRGSGWAIFGGVGIRYASMQHGAADSSKNGESDDPEFVTLDAGVVLEITDYIRIGVVGQNLIDTVAIYEAPRLIGVGAALQYEGFEVSFDLDMDLQTDPNEEVLLSYKVGLQYLIQGTVVIRGGYNYDGRVRENRIAVGASYVSKLIGVDLGFQRSLDRGADTIVCLGVKVFVP